METDQDKIICLVEKHLNGTHFGGQFRKNIQGCTYNDKNARLRKQYSKRKSISFTERFVGTRETSNVLNSTDLFAASNLKHLYMMKRIRFINVHTSTSYSVKEVLLVEND